MASRISQPLHDYEYALEYCSPPRNYGEASPLQNQASPEVKEWEENEEAMSQIDKDHPRRNMALMLVAILLGLIALLIESFIFFGVLNDLYYRGGDVYTTAPQGEVMNRFDIMQDVLESTIGVAITASAFWAARRWAQARRDSPNEERPTALQLGVASNLFSGPNPLAFWSGLTYTVRLTKDGRRHRVKRPPMLRFALLMASLAFLLIYWSKAAKWALTPNTVSLALAKSSAWHGPSVLASRIIDDRYCAGFGSSNHSDLCGLADFGTAPYLESAGEGQRVYTNSSSKNAVVFSDTQMALLAPSTVPSNASFDAATTGIQVSCSSVTEQCLDPSRDNDTLHWNCPSSVNFVPVVVPGNPEFYFVGPLTTQGRVFDPREDSIPATNPFRYGAIVSSVTYAQPNAGYVLSKDGSNSGFYSWGYDLDGPFNVSYNALVCNVSIYDTTYRFTNGTYISLTASLSDLLMAHRTQWASIQVGAFEATLLNPIDGVGLRSDTSFAHAFQQQLARLTMARLAYIYQAAPENAIIQSESVLGTRIPLGLLVLFMIPIFLYIFLLVYILFFVLTRGIGDPSIDRTQYRLTSAIPVVQAAYGDVDEKRSWRASDQALFGEETDEHRLDIGPVLLPGHTGHSFGISRVESRPATEAGLRSMIY